MTGTAKRMKPGDAWTTVLGRFPFEGYIRPRRRSSYLRLVSEAHSVLNGGRILDFGAGPADKTALFSLTGFDVVAYDDFEDPWHKVHGNREKILNFANSVGIDYRWQGGLGNVLRDGETFDMVMLHHVLEHLHDSPKDLMLALLDRLSPGGFLFVSVPNAANIRKRLAVAFGSTNYPSYSSYYWYPGGFRGHIREYVKDDLVSLAKFLDLRVRKLSSYFHFPQVLPEPVLWMLDKVCYVAPGWRDSWMLIAQKPRQGWNPERTRAGRHLASSLGRSEYYDYSDFQPTSSDQPVHRL